jgi:hypothetical protein
VAADNLAVTFTGDSSKLRYDLELLKASLKDAQKELTALAATASKTGAATDQFKAIAKSNEVDQLTRSLAGMRRELAATAQVMKPVAVGASQIEAGFKSAGEMALGLRDAVKGLLALEAVRKIVDQFRDVTREITELRNTAKAAGLRTGDVQVFTDAIENSGESADGARQALIHLTDQIAQTRTQMRGFRPGAIPGVTTLRGGQPQPEGFGVRVERGGERAGPFGGPVVIRGAASALKTVEDIVKRITENAAKFPLTKEGLLSPQALQSILKDLQAISKQDATLGTSVGVALLGRRYGIFAAALKDLAEGKNWQATLDKLAAQGRLIPDDDTRVQKYNTAVKDLGDSYQKLQFAIALPLVPRITAGLNWAAGMVERFDEIGQAYDDLKNKIGLGAIEEAIVGPIRNGLNAAAAAIQQFGLSIPGPIGAVFTILGDLIKLSIDALTLDFSSMWTDFTRLATDAITAVIGLFQGLSDAVTAIVAGLGSAWSSFFSGIQSAAQATADAIKSIFASVSSAVSSAVSAGGGDYGGGGFAAGGIVRGPGSGTSDSILARLSNGEFVMRAAAVQHWGPQFMAALNGLANPGLSRSGVPRFASGGMVSAGGGGRAAVHLHLGGHSFALSGNDNVVSALVVEANRYKIRSAGVKPSWYGGTPGR